MKIILFSLIALLCLSFANPGNGQIPPPPPASTASKPDPEGKIERELQQMERATRQIIEQYAGLPRPGVYVAPISAGRPDCGEAKILFCPSEGGHGDDSVELVSVKGDSVFRLPLYHHFGKDGYDLLIESEIDEGLIRRTVVERYGWENDLEKQPRSETRQVFRLEKDGSIVLVEEETMQVLAPPAKN
jgi:hypothetical protein